MTAIFAHVSADSETWGTRAGCDIRSIGAVLFDPLTGEELNKFYVACENPVVDNMILGVAIPDHYTPREIDKIAGEFRHYNLHRDERTVDWWYDQASPEAQAAFANPVDLKEGLLMFAQWLQSIGADPKNEHSVRIWGHGASFDPPIFEAGYHAVGLPVPWHYRAPRDTRTAFDLARIYDHKRHMERFKEGVFHHAYWDSRNQANAIAQANKDIHDAFEYLSLKT